MQLRPVGHVRKPPVLREMSPTDPVMHASIVGVRSVLPMMICLIPSFMLPGVVPAVVSAIFNGFA
jgi:hypothetical protein